MHRLPPRRVSVDADSMNATICTLDSSSFHLPVCLDPFESLERWKSVLALRTWWINLWTRFSKDETCLPYIFRLHFFTCLPGPMEECEPLLLSSFSVSISLLPILPSVSTSTWTALFAGSVQIEQTINVMSVGWTNMHFSVQWWRRRESKLQGGIWNDRRGTTTSRLSRWDSKDHMLHFVYRAVTISAKFGQWKHIYTLAQSLPTEYLNEILTMPEATRSHSPLHSIWGIHAVFPTASFIFLKAGSILHSPPTSSLVMPSGKDWASIQVSRRIYCKSKARKLTASGQ